MPDNGNERLPRIATHKFFDFTLKNMTWRAYLISFKVPYCFLFCFVCIELVSLLWFLKIWVAIYVYGTMINWSTLIKKLMQTYIVTASGSILNVSVVHLNGIWHLIWRYLSKPVLGGHPVLSGHYSMPWGCPLNTGFTVFRMLRNNADAHILSLRYSLWFMYILSEHRYRWNKQWIQYIYYIITIGYTHTLCGLPVIGMTPKCRSILSALILLFLKKFPLFNGSIICRTKRADSLLHLDILS